MGQWIPRLVLISVLTLSFGACSDSPTAPDALGGWTLRTVDGVALPFGETHDFTGNTIWWTWGHFRLAANDSFRIVVTKKDGDLQAAAVSVDTTAGTYRVEDGTMSLYARTIFKQPLRVATVAIDGMTATVTGLDGHVLVFRRRYFH